MSVGIIRSIAREFAPMSNSHFLLSPLAISMYALTVPSGFVGSVSRHTCFACAVAAFRLVARADVADAANTSGGRVTSWPATDQGRRATNTNIRLTVALVSISVRRATRTPAFDSSRRVDGEHHG